MVTQVQANFTKTGIPTHKTYPQNTLSSFLMRYLLIILLLLTQNTHAQETDVQRSGLKGPVKWYQHKEYKASTGDPSLKYEIRSSQSNVYDEKGAMVADIYSNTFTNYDKNDLPATDYKHIAWQHEPRSGDFVIRKGYILDNEKDTSHHKVGYYKYDEHNRLIEIRETNPHEKDSAISKDLFTYHSDGRLDSNVTLVYLKKGVLVSAVVNRHSYGPHTDTFSAIIQNRVIYFNVSTFDSLGRKQEVITWQNGKVSGAEYYFYSDTKTEPGYMSKTHPLATTGADYMYFTIWDKDIHGNYLKKKAHKEGFIQEEEWEIEYYK